MFLLLVSALACLVLHVSTMTDSPTNHSTESSDSSYLDYIVYYEMENKNVSKPEKELNKAWLTVNSSVNYDIELWAQSDECYKCEMMYITTAPGNAVFTLLVNATYGTRFGLVKLHPDGTHETLCRFHSTFQEDGDYWVFIEHTSLNEETTCDVVLANSPDIAELPILYVGVSLIALAILYVVGKKVFCYIRQFTSHRRSSMDINPEQDSTTPERIGNGKVSEPDQENATKGDGDKPKLKTRLRSLDTFRGFTLVLMIFVNYGGGGYWFFEHSPWNGVYVADLVFPWFVFIMGVSMNFSFKSMFRKGWSIPRIIWKIVLRSFKLFVIGFMLGTTHYVADMETVRVLGVLQRLALTYLISALIHLCCVRKFDSHQDRRWAPIRDLVLYSPEWLVNIVVLALHSGIVYGLPVPGCPTGYVGPGGLSEGGKFQNCTGGATRYVDALMLTNNHMYQYPTPQALYQTTMPFDPEGFLGTLNCVFLCFLGIQCGRIILLYQGHKQRILRFVIWGAVLGALSALLTKCSQDDGWIPPNKNIWSLSYTLICASFGFFLLLAMYAVLDVLNVWRGQPFSYIGMNSILIYCCHAIFYKTFPVGWEVEEIHWKLLVRSVWGAAVWVAVSYCLFYKKIFITI